MGREKHGFYIELTSLIVLVLVVLLDFLVRAVVSRTKDEDDYENTVQPFVLSGGPAAPTTAWPWQDARGTEPSGHLEKGITGRGR